jgi:hypothetical protein
MALKNVANFVGGILSWEYPMENKMFCCFAGNIAADLL